MTANTWCKHESGRFSLKFKQVQNRIAKEHCFVWVIPGKVFRNATPQEAFTMRVEAPKQDEGMGYFIEVTDKNGKVSMLWKPYYAEIPECHTQWSTAEQQTTSRQSWPLIAEANRLAAQNG